MMLYTTCRVTFFTGIIYLLLTSNAFSQTISWSGYAAGTFSYSTGPLSATITNNGSTGYQSGSPFYQPDNNPLAVSGDCGSEGLVLYMDWGANANTANYSTTLTLNFSQCV